MYFKIQINLIIKFDFNLRSKLIRIYITIKKLIKLKIKFNFYAKLNFLFEFIYYINSFKFYFQTLIFILLIIIILLWN